MATHLGGLQLGAEGTSADAAALAYARLTAGSVPGSAEAQEFADLLGDLQRGGARHRSTDAGRLSRGAG